MEAVLFFVIFTIINTAVHNYINNSCIFIIMMTYYSLSICVCLNFFSKSSRILDLGGDVSNILIFVSYWDYLFIWYVIAVGTID